VYLISGVFSGHLRNDLLVDNRILDWPPVVRVMPNGTDLGALGGLDTHGYDAVQRMSYLIVIFLAMPAMIWTGMAMSPAVTSVFPFFVTSLGGHQTARTLHFSLQFF
jgi:thiosulfate reductase cytochrome b subunit